MVHSQNSVSLDWLASGQNLVDFGTPPHRLKSFAIKNESGLPTALIHPTVNGFVRAAR